MLKRYKRLTGSYKLNDPIVIIGIFLIAAIISYVVAFGGIRYGIILMFTPIGLVFLNRLFSDPSIGLMATVIMAFFAIGITRYVPGIPLGLSIDGLLALTFIAVFFKNFYTRLKPEAFYNDLVL